MFGVNIDFLMIKYFTMSRVKKGKIGEQKFCFSIHHKRVFKNNSPVYDEKLMCISDADVRSKKSFLKQGAIFQHIFMPYKIFRNA